MASLESLLVALTYPPTLSLALGAGAVVALLRWRRAALALATLAVGWTLLWSVPRASDGLRLPLEQRFPPLAESALPASDAIVVLGGGNYDWLDRGQVDPEALRSSRLAAGARAWLAGRAPVVILSGGRGGRHSEAEEMARAITHLGVPASALVLEQHSRDTRDNALFTARLAQRRGYARILLVTSALHMPRARLLFRQAGLAVVPVPVPERAFRETWASRWLPSRGALWRSGRALKEYAALLAAQVQGPRCDAAGVKRASSRRAASAWHFHVAEAKPTVGSLRP